MSFNRSQFPYYMQLVAFHYLLANGIYQLKLIRGDWKQFKLINLAICSLIDICIIINDSCGIRVSNRNILLISSPPGNFLYQLSFRVFDVVGYFIYLQQFCGKKTHRCLLLVNNTIWSGAPQLSWLLVSFDGNYPTTSNLIFFGKRCPPLFVQPGTQHPQEGMFFE